MEREQLLEGDLAAEIDLTGQVDDRGAAATDLAVDLVTPDLPSDMHLDAFPHSRAYRVLVPQPRCGAAPADVEFPRAHHATVRVRAPVRNHRLPRQRPAVSSVRLTAANSVPEPPNVQRSWKAP